MAYDIREPGRLRAIHACMLGYGYAMQYSVFICDLDRMDLIHLRRDLGDRIVPSVDSIAIVDLGDAESETRFEFLGAHLALPTSGPTIV